MLSVVLVFCYWLGGLGVCCCFRCRYLDVFIFVCL